MMYYYPSFRAAYTGVNTYANATKQNVNTTRNWLEGERAYTLHKPARRRMSAYRPYKTSHFGYQLQADLNDMTIKGRYKGYRYIVTVIDVFSRYAWARALKSKKPSELRECSKHHIFSEIKPTYLQTDRGLEFYGQEFQRYLSHNNVHLFSVNSTHKACIVERFNRTLKSRLARYMTHKNTNNWVDVLQDIVNGYNNTPHSSLPNKLSPSDARKMENWWMVWDHWNSKSVKKGKQKFNIGDSVRVSKLKTAFEKGYATSWSEEVYTIFAANTKEFPIMYTLKDYNNEIIDGKFYTQELQKVKPPTHYPIEKIYKRQGNKYLVSLLGHNPRERYWVDL